RLVLELAVGVRPDLVGGPGSGGGVAPGQLHTADRAVEVVEVDARVVDDPLQVGGESRVAGRVIRPLRDQVQRPVVGPRLAVGGRVVHQVGVAVVGDVVVGPGH